MEHHEHKEEADERRHEHEAEHEHSHEGCCHEEGASHADCCHGHGHHHGHSHSHSYADMTGKRLLATSLLNIIFTLVEIVGGIISNSLSLLSDALHNLADSSAIFVAYIAHLISKRKPTTHKTFGFRRFEILAAFLNSVLLIGICLYLFVEAYRRYAHRGDSRASCQPRLCLHFAAR